MAYIKKEPIVDFITKGLNNPDKTKAFGYDAIEILTEIELAPVADVVEVVRCKNCQYSNVYTTWRGEEHCRCTIDDGVNVAEPTHFCSYGEKENT